jgi:hypothetical protein
MMKWITKFGVKSLGFQQRSWHINRSCISEPFGEAAWYKEMYQRFGLDLLITGLAVGGNHEQNGRYVPQQRHPFPIIGSQDLREQVYVAEKT